MAVQMDNGSREALNGAPDGPNGFLTLVKGGLYSGVSGNCVDTSIDPQWAASLDVIDSNSLQAMLPGYTAWVEDKLLQAIMRESKFCA
jgi:hypothetical protein